MFRCIVLIIKDIRQIPETSKTTEKQKLKKTSSSGVFEKSSQEK